jgi:hypothetical protein
MIQDMIPFIQGEPSVGEVKTTNEWKKIIKDKIDIKQCNIKPESIDLQFFLSEQKFYDKDLDNMVRPALDALKDAKICKYAFRGLKEVTASKNKSDNLEQGLKIKFNDTERRGALNISSRVKIEANINALDEYAVKWAIYEASLDYYRENNRVYINVDLAVDIVVQLDHSNINKSIKELIKPSIDGLEPVLGRNDGLAPLEDKEGRYKWRLDPKDSRIVTLNIRIEPGVTNKINISIDPKK